jgi:hypothetical protein
MLGYEASRKTESMVDSWMILAQNVVLSAHTLIL